MPSVVQSGILNSLRAVERELSKSLCAALSSAITTGEDACHCTDARTVEAGQSSRRRCHESQSRALLKQDMAGSSAPMIYSFGSLRRLKLHASSLRKFSVSRCGDAEARC